MSTALAGIELNTHQSDQFAAFALKHIGESQSLQSHGFNPLPPIANIVPFKCEVPGMAAVVCPDGVTLKLLYPCARPVPRDPLFQHAEAVSDHRPIVMKVRATRAWMRDWMLDHGCRMDAPDVMPAGSCEGFATEDEDAFGAFQSTCEREG